MIIEAAQNQQWVVSEEDFGRIFLNLLPARKTFTYKEAVDLCAILRVEGRYTPYLVTELLKILLEYGSIREQNGKYAVYGKE